MTMTPTLSRYLSRTGVPYDLVDHSHAETARGEAAAGHVPADHTAKGVLLQDDRGVVLAVVPASHWLKLDTLCSTLNRELTLVPEQDLSTTFPDCVAGAVPAAGPAYAVDTVLDEALLGLANVYFEAGDHRQLVHVDGDGFRALLAGARTGRFSHPGRQQGNY
ncbi:MAG: YbaK/EbsC family protein [Gammaproteobacteria bacterium]